jgi:hypothetical protein
VLVAYRRENGEKEWSYGILALGLEMLPKALFTPPRVEWLGPNEILVGLGVGPTGVTVLSLFRKKDVHEPEREVTVEGDIRGWGGPSEDLSWMRIKVGADEVNPDMHGRFSLRITGHGRFRAYSPDGWSLNSHLNPQTFDVDLDGPPVAHVKLAMVRHEGPREVPQPGQ